MTSTIHYVLFYRLGEDAWLQYPLSTENITIGRDSSCSLMLDHPKVSREHAAIQYKPDGIWLTDLDSKNGTKVGEQRIGINLPIRLNTNQDFTIGPYTFKIVEEEFNPVALHQPVISMVAAPSVPPNPPKRNVQRKYIPLIIAAFGGVCCLSGVFIYLASLVFFSPQEASKPGSKTPVVVVNTARPGAKPTPLAQKQTWLVMIYSNADDEALELDLIYDMNEAEAAGSDKNVKTVIQMDRAVGGYQGDGDWTTTKRFLVSKDEDMSHLNSKEISDLGELNMGEKKSLVDFVTWAVKSYPSNKYVLFISNHGSGWPGISYDSDPPNPDTENGSKGITITELDEALGEIRTQTGVKRLDVIGLDACLMGQLEVFTSLVPHVRYAVASEEVVPWTSFAYLGFLKALIANPAMGSDDLARKIVSTYIDEDGAILDDGLRADYASEVYGKETMSVKDVINSVGAITTISAVDLDAIPPLLKSLDNLTNAMTKTNQESVARARAFTQSFYSVFGEDAPPSYIDLVHFTQMLKSENNEAGVTRAADEVAESVKKAVIAEKHGSQRPSANGIAIYFPNSGLYGTDYAGFDAYTKDAKRFAEESQWKNFLSFHYTNTPLQNNKPEPGAQISAPGASGVTIDPIQASETAIRQSGKTTLQTSVKGQRIGYIYEMVGLYDPDSDLMQMMYADYLISEKSKSIGGTYYPDWGKSGLIKVSVDWKPRFSNITDGENSEFALLKPDQYGATPEEIQYSVKGIYIFGDTGKQRSAKMIFDSEGNMLRVLGFANKELSGAPREITPKDGDKFTILKEWARWSKVKQGTLEFVDSSGGTLTFSTKKFHWVPVLADPSPYHVGFLVEDLDGNRYGQFTVITVKP